MNTVEAFVVAEKIIWETFVPHLFFGNKKIPITHRRSYKCDASHEIRIGSPEYSDLRKK